MPIYESWFSSKVSGLALRYDIPVSIRDHSIFWINVLFFAGRLPNITLFWDHLGNDLDHIEQSIADSKYSGHGFCKFYHRDNSHMSAHAIVSARHETLNYDWNISICYSRHSDTVGTYMFMHFMLYHHWLSPCTVHMCTSWSKAQNYVTKLCD